MGMVYPSRTTVNSLFWLQQKNYVELFLICEWLLNSYSVIVIYFSNFALKFTTAFFLLKCGRWWNNVAQVRNGIRKHRLLHFSINQNPCKFSRVVQSECRTGWMVEAKLNGNVRVFIDRKFIGSEKICGFIKNCSQCFWFFLTFFKIQMKVFCQFIFVK